MITSRLDAYISRYGDFCANDNNDDNDDQPITLPRAHARGVIIINGAAKKLIHIFLKNTLLAIYPVDTCKCVKLVISPIIFHNTCMHHAKNLLSNNYDDNFHYSGRFLIAGYITINSELHTSSQERKQRCSSSTMLMELLEIIHLFIVEG